MNLVDLRRIARLCGVATTFSDGFHRRRSASKEALEGVLTAYGAIEGGDDAGSALRRIESELAKHLVDPVLVAWTGTKTRVQLRAPASVEVALELESGVAKEWRVDDAHALELPGVPLGYHTLTVRQADGREQRSLVIAAPTLAWRSR
ncbi:MAG: hypothetical protein ABR548_11925, partial [Actinomycetota bacterium]